MGYLKSMRELNKMGRQISNETDFTAMRQNGLAKMGRMQEVMAAQTKAANIAATGVAATASVIAIRQTGQLVNFEQVIELDLTVMPDGLPPYPVSITQTISPIHLPRIQPGAALAVKVDAEDPASVWIDLTRAP